MPHDAATLDAAFTALSSWDWGADAKPLTTLDAAVVAAHGDQALRADLERRLTALLGSGASRGAKEEACRRLTRVGSAASVPSLARLLPDRDLSHMARFALERIDAADAAAALREAVASLTGPLRIGMVSSLAARRDTESVPQLAGLLTADAATAAAAAVALGSIATSAAAAALQAGQGDPCSSTGAAIADARLACAESLRASGHRDAALGILRSLAETAAGKPAARQIELAATRGILACLDTAAS